MTEEKIRAMVLAAGVGSRLAPLSDTLPKPLIRIAGKVIMEHILLLLKEHGIKDVISNTHHLAKQIQDYFKDIKIKEAINLEFVYEEKLSGVAGGIRACQDFLRQGTACIIMGDALTDLDLTSLYHAHKKAVNENNCLATLAMMQVEDTSQFGVVLTEAMLDPNKTNAQTKNRIVKFQEKPKAQDALSNWANTGVYFFEPEIYDYIPSEKEAAKYDVAHDLFPKLLEQGKYLQAIAVDKNTYWADLGTPKQYLQSVKDIHENKIKLKSIAKLNQGLKLGKNSTLNGYCDVATDAVIGDNVILENCVVYPKSQIADGSTLTNCILGENSYIAANSKFTDQIIVRTKVH